MATLTGPRAAATFPVAGAGIPKGVPQMAWGYYNFTVNPTSGDVVRLCRLPKGATVIDGWFIGADIDTGTEALDIDIGWEDNGTDGADTDGFGNFGTIDGDTINQLKPVAGIRYGFANIVQDNAFKTFSAETIVSALVNTAANAGGTGYIKVVIWYEVL